MSASCAPASTTAKFLPFTRHSKKVVSRRYPILVLRGPRYRNRKNRLYLPYTQLLIDLDFCLYAEMRRLADVAALSRSACFSAGRIDQLRRACPERHGDSRVVDTFVWHDIGLLARSGAFSATAELRRLDGRDGLHAGVADRDAPDTKSTNR